MDDETYGITWMRVGYLFSWVENIWAFFFSRLGKLAGYPMLTYRIRES